MNLIKINKYNGVDQKDLYVAYGAYSGDTKYNFEYIYLNNCGVRYQKFSYDKDVNYDMSLVNESEIIKDPFFEDTNGVDDFQYAINNNKKYADEIKYIIDYDNRHIDDLYDSNNHITIKCLNDIDKFFDKFVEHDVQKEHDEKAVKNNTIGLLRNLKIFNVLSYVVVLIFWFIALCFANPAIITTTNVDNVLDLTTFGIVYGIEICIFLAFAINENKSNRVYNILSLLFVLIITIAIYCFQLESLGVHSVVLFETVIFLNVINDSIAKSFMKEYDIKY